MSQEANIVIFDDDEEDKDEDEPVSKPARRAKAKVCIFPNHCRPTVTNYSTELKDRREAASAKTSRAN